MAALFTGDPYRSFSDSRLLRSLTRARRSAPTGTYSNFGFAARGRVLGILNGNDYRRALASRLLQPLGLDDTFLDPGGEVACRHARGHDLLGVPTPHWHARAMAGAGGVSMTLADGAAWTRHISALDRAGFSVIRESAARWARTANVSVWRTVPT